MLGFLGWILLTPLAYFCYAVIVYLDQRVVKIAQEPHPLTRLLSEGPAGSEVVVIVLTAVIAAPVLEELFFRGLVQPWLGRSYKSSLMGLGLAFVLAAVQRQGKIADGWHDAGWLGVVQEAQALFFAALMAPGYFLVVGLTRWAMQQWYAYRQAAGGKIHPRSVAHRLDRDARAVGGIYAASLVFAAAHSFAWPHPVSLFPLALGLGFIRYRTQSLAGPILLHALFNGVACFMFLAYPSLVPREEKGNETTSALCPVSEPSTCTAVPGSQLPRRMYASAIGPSLGETAEDVTWPTSLPSRNSFLPAESASGPRTRTPISMRLTGPRSRAMTIGS
jgi:membrane protease YdiL (CAAX protease family)